MKLKTRFTNRKKATFEKNETKGTTKATFEINKTDENNESLGQC